MLVVLSGQHLFDIFRIDTDFTGLCYRGRNSVTFVGPFSEIDKLTAFAAKRSVFVVF